MKKFNDWVATVQEAELSDLQKSYREYFEAKLKKYGVGSPADLDEEQKKSFFNEIAADWEKGKGVSRYSFTAGGPNSCVLGSAGELYVCQNGGTTGPWRADKMVEPSIQVIFSEGENAQFLATEIDGIKFNGPNDLVFGNNGCLYFTDPGTYNPANPHP